MKKLLIIFTSLMLSCTALIAQQDTVRYTGSTLVNIDYHHGQLRPAMGVHNIQTFRANREHPDWAGGNSWTYNHAPMLAYDNGTFFLQYLSNPVGEHVAPGQTLMLKSKDGYQWSAPEIVFPSYKIPEGTVKAGRTDTAKDDYAVMHQRIGFHKAKNGKLLTLGFYGIVLGEKDDPNDGNGIGRVVREIKSDGSYGAIYFLRYNHAFNEKNTSFPFYKTSNDKAFIAACDELLNTPLQMQQMVEEADRNDPLIPLQKEFKAFSYYHLPDGRVAGFWKYALTSISKDNGKSWIYNPTRAPGFVNSNAKIWGQKASDGSFLTVYNPSEFRWPLAVSVSTDGLSYKNLLLVNGEISGMRYGGAYKSYGPQYVRGIQEGEGTPPGGHAWVTYSMNKEDMWVSRIKLPVTDRTSSEVNETFNDIKEETALNEWNIFSPLWCKTGIESLASIKALALNDSDPFDYAKAERVFPASTEKTIEFTIEAAQNNTGMLAIELQDGKSTACLRLSFDSTGSIVKKDGYREKSVAKYKAGEKIKIRIRVNTKTRFYTLSINDGKESNNICFAPVSEVEKIVFRTGVVRRFPDADTPTDQNYDLPGAGEKTAAAKFFIYNLKTSK